MNHTPAAKLLDTFCDGLDATIDGRGWDAEHDAARKEIVRRCNAHEALVAALEDAVERLARVDAELLRATGQPFEYEIGEVLRGRAALKLARGE